MKPATYPLALTVNEIKVTTVKIGRHYLKKHAAYMNDALILELVSALDGSSFEVDSITSGVEYYVADIEHGDKKKRYRVIWIFEGDDLEILGVVNAYRRRK